MEGLAAHIRQGEYEVDAHAVAEAILRRLSEAGPVDEREPEGP